MKAYVTEIRINGGEGHECNIVAEDMIQAQEDLHDYLESLVEAAPAGEEVEVEYLELEEHSIH